MAYSSAHRRLFCITSALKLEAWDVGGHDLPRLDWVAHLDGLDTAWLDRIFVACEEQSGQLFLVARHICSEEVLDLRFKVYRMDQGVEDLTLMRDSFLGMTFFRGKEESSYRD
ncbi:hypothetical protein OROMI_029990 [Orobanche minor]